MSHDAALYTVRVHRNRHPEDLQLLGAIGPKEQSQLIWVLHGYMTELVHGSEDGYKQVACDSVLVDESMAELRVRLNLSASGQRVDHYAGNELVFAQQPPDMATVKSGALFRIPPDGNIGFLSLYVPDRRGSISLLRAAVRSRFQDDFPGFQLKIEAAIEGTALARAVAENKVQKVSLIRRGRHADAFAGGVDKWVQQGAVAEIALEIRWRNKQHLVPTLLRRYLDGDDSAFGEIIEFEGLEFETARVTVDEGAGSKTYNVQNPESGHAMTLAIGDQLDLDEDGWPMDDSLFGALRSALPSVTGGA